MHRGQNPDLQIDALQTVECKKWTRKLSVASFGVRPLMEIKDIFLRQIQIHINPLCTKLIY